LLSLYPELKLGENERFEFNKSLQGNRTVSLLGLIEVSPGKNEVPR
jgi:hypothetical protein